MANKKKYTEYKYFAPYFISKIKETLKRKTKTIKCDITHEDLDYLWIAQNGKCYYTNIELTLPDFTLGSKFIKKRKYDHTVSVDRIDSNLNYTKDNIVLCHRDINRLKNKYSLEDFLNLCKEVSLFHSNDKS